MEGIENYLNEGLQFYTGAGVNVTSAVKAKKTFVSKCRKEAAAKANLLRSYVYEINAQDKKEKRPEFFGYAVPK